ncbi:MAG: hypothetical protein DRN04_07870 [Thermoprotei archaeon]|nr:MAG: hypothetical protein DRN04_07870 [Thermoprotei archaeon]
MRGELRGLREHMLSETYSSERRKNKKKSSRVVTFTVPEELYIKMKKYVELKGYRHLSEFIRQAIRKQIEDYRDYLDESLKYR